MTRYIYHKHGLLIGSDNIFFLRDDEGFRDMYRATVSAKCYHPTKHENFGYGISTPAQQLIWSDLYQDDMKYRLTHQITWWLNENIGAKKDKWDARRVTEMQADPVFFRSRNDAVKFVNFIKEIVGGLTFDKN